MPDAPPHPAVPGQALVSRRALVEIVRTAVLGSYGVMGLGESFLGRLGLGRRAHPGEDPARRHRRRAPDDRLRPSRRRGGAPGRLRRSATPCAAALGRDVGAVTIHVEGLATGPFTTPGAGASGTADATSRAPGEDAT